MTDINRDALLIKTRATQLNDSNAQVVNLQHWIDNLIAELDNACGPDHQGYQQIRTNLYYGRQTLLGDYVKWMSDVAQQLDQLGDRVMQIGFQ